jgi:hypothetical protein
LPYCHFAKNIKKGSSNKGFVLKGAFKIDGLIKHDKYIEVLCDQIDPHYDLLVKHVPLYSAKKSTKRKVLLGEIDVLAFHEDGFYDIFEVKCSRRLYKAKRQLQRIKRALLPDKRLKKVFFYCGESGEIHVVE